MEEKRTRISNAAVMQALDDMTSRLRAASALDIGSQFDGRRDVYETFGYPRHITFKQYLEKFKRHAIARASIQVPVRSCWRNPPDVVEDEHTDTKFEQDWRAFAKTHRVWHYLSRLDQMAGIGEYAVLLFGLNDNLALDQPVVNATEVAYLMPFMQGSAKIDEFERDPLSPRYGQPKLYEITMKLGSQQDRLRVHWSRVLHVCEEQLESEVCGEPANQGAYNHLDDLEKVVGGSAEAFFRGGWNGIVLSQDAAAAEPTPKEKADFEQAVWRWVNMMDRVMRVRGMTAQGMEPNIASPRDHVDVLLDLISAVRRIPKRLLLGSERGELASTQDENNWNARVAERKVEHCEATILRPFIDRLCAYGVVPTPSVGYEIRWPQAAQMSATERAEVGAKRAEALATYCNAPGADSIVPVEIALQEFVGMDRAQLDQIEAILQQMQRDGTGPRDTSPAPSQGAA